VVFAMTLSSPASLSLLVDLSRTPEFAAILFFGLSGDDLFTPKDQSVICVTPELGRDQEEYANILYAQITSRI
jgi:hypothetical protein